jgi:hypothetical protein
VIFQTPSREAEGVFEAAIKKRLYEGKGEVLIISDGTGFFLRLPLLDWDGIVGG